MLEVESHGHPRQHIYHGNRWPSPLHFTEWFSISAQAIYRFLADTACISGEDRSERTMIDMIDTNAEYMLAEHRSQPFYGKSDGIQGAPLFVSPPSQPSKILDISQTNHWHTWKMIWEATWLRCVRCWPIIMLAWAPSHSLLATNSAPLILQVSTYVLHNAAMILCLAVFSVLASIQKEVKQALTHFPMLKEWCADAWNALLYFGSWTQITFHGLSGGNRWQNTRLCKTAQILIFCSWCKHDYDTRYIIYMLLLAQGSSAMVFEIFPSSQILRKNTPRCNIFQNILINIEHQNENYWI